MDFDSASAFWRLGLLSPQEMRDVANDLLAAGEEHMDVALLAGLTDAELGGASELFKQVAHRSGKDTMSAHEAARSVVRWVASRIVQGQVEPYKGARQIWHASLAVKDPTFHDADPFIYAASEYENRPEDRRAFAEEILREARRWLAR